MQLQQGVASRARSFLDKLPDAKRRKMRMDAKAPRSDVGLLRESHTMEWLSSHVLVLRNGVDALAVYRVMERLLGKKKREAPEPKAPLPGARALETEACPGCKRVGTVVMEKTFNGIFCACSSCGASQDQIISYGNPYRAFADDPASKDRVHFESIDSEPEKNQMVEQLGVQFGFSPAVEESALALLRSHPRAGHELPSAIAALLLCSMDYDAEKGELHERPPPTPPGRCAKCGAGCGSLREARFHCKGVVGITRVGRCEP